MGWEVQVHARRVAIGGLLIALLCVTDGAVAGAGGRMWHRELRGAGLGAVTVDAARHIFVTGSAWTKVHVRALLVAKYGPAGGLAWRRTWRRGGLWFAYGAALVPAPGGGVYVAGHSGRYEGWSPVLWRYSASGRLLWHRTLPSPLGRGEMVSLASTGDGLIAAVNNSATGGPTAGGNFIYAFDHDGRVEWRTEFAVPGITGTMNWISGIAVGGDGRVYVAGTVSRSPLFARYQDFDVVVQELDRGGHVGWTRVFGDPRVRDLDDSRSVAVGSHRVIVTGSINDGSQGAVWAFTTTGRRVWQHRLDPCVGSTDVAPWHAVYLITCRTVPGPGDTTTAISALRRYTPGGKLVWKRRVSKDGSASGLSARGGVYLTIGHSLERWRR